VAAASESADLLWPPGVCVDTDTSARADPRERDPRVVSWIRVAFIASLVVSCSAAKCEANVEVYVWMAIEHTFRKRQ
jgi:hypothetical protein